MGKYRSQKKCEQVQQANQEKRKTGKGYIHAYVRNKESNYRYEAFNGLSKSNEEMNWPYIIAACGLYVGYIIGRLHQLYIERKPK